MVFLFVWNSQWTRIKQMDWSPYMSPLTLDQISSKSIKEVLETL